MKRTIYEETIRIYHGAGPMRIQVNPNNGMILVESEGMQQLLPPQVVALPQQSLTRFVPCKTTRLLTFNGE
jgi:hypothetical protein